MLPLRKAIYYENIKCQLEDNFEKNKEKTKNITIIALKNANIKKVLSNTTKEQKKLLKSPLKIPLKVNLIKIFQKNF